MAKNSPNLMKTKILIYISKKFNKTPNKISTRNPQLSTSYSNWRKMRKKWKEA